MRNRLAAAAVLCLLHESAKSVLASCEHTMIIDAFDRAASSDQLRKYR